MGYTHYWTPSKKEASPEVVKQFKDAFQSMLKLVPNTIQTDYFGDDVIRFNGIDHGDEDLSHETMEVRFDGGGEWNFCKTARKPYDVVVVASLIIAEKLGMIASWSSDGDAEDHVEGRNLAEKVS